jgi:hypothetical protein
VVSLPIAGLKLVPATTCRRPLWSLGSMPNLLDWMRGKEVGENVPRGNLLRVALVTYLNPAKAPLQAVLHAISILAHNSGQQP